MPTHHRIRIPQTGTTIDWPPSDAGRIHVNGTLPVPGRDSRIKVELSFKPDPFRKVFKRSEVWYGLRRVLARVQEQQPTSPEELQRLCRLTEKEVDLILELLPHYDPDRPTEVQSLRPDELLQRWGFEIVWLLCAAAGIVEDARWQRKTRSRKRLQVLNDEFNGIAYRLIIDREDLRLLRDHLGKGIREDKRCCARFGGHLSRHLLPTALIDLALRGRPRGKPNAQAQRDLMAVVRCAVYVAEQLLETARRDEAMHARLESVLASEGYPDGVGGTLRIMGLVDRALRPALKRAGLDKLALRNASAILDPTASEELAEMFNAHPEALQQWFGYLLGPEGHAARSLKLVR